MEILNLHLEIGTDEDHSEFIEIPVSKRTKSKINELIIKQNGKSKTKG